LIFKKPAGQSPKSKAIDDDIGVKAQMDEDRLETAFFRISSAISAHDDLPTTLELILRESLICLRAQRSTIFLLEKKSGILKPQFTYAPNPMYGNVGLLEEKEVARKAFGLMKSYLLQGPKDFSDFLKHQESEPKITSLMCMPLSSRGKPIGVLSLVLIKGDRGFAETGLPILSIFGNHASIAIENSHLQEELRKRINFQRSYQKYLDETLNQLQNLPEEERGRIEEHIRRLLPQQKAGEKESIKAHPMEEGEGVTGDLGVSEESRTDRGQDNRAGGMPRVEFGKESLSLADKLIPGGIFIRTPNPMELGEEFVLKLHILDGEEPIEVPCRVIWTNRYGRESNNSRRGMVIKLLKVQREDQKRIEECIRSQNDSNELNLV
jgi:Tfp pilus assembly protein PilZ